METQSGFIVKKLLFVVGLVLVLTVVPWAARQADEGELLFPFKLLGDQIEYYLTPGEEGKIELKLERLEEINTEIRKAKIRNDQEKIAGKTEEFKDERGEIKKEIEELKEKGKNTEELELELDAITDSNSCAVAAN